MVLPFSRLLSIRPSCTFLGISTLWVSTVVSKAASSKFEEQVVVFLSLARYSDPLRESHK